MIYVTSQPVSEAIIEYYLGLLSGVIPSHARADSSWSGRRRVAAPLSSSCWPGHGFSRDPVAIPNPARSHLIPYNTHALERDVALSPAFRCTGRIPRSGPGYQDRCRKMFEECGVRYPVGVEGLRTADDIVTGVRNARGQPSLRLAIVKMNDGVRARETP